MISRYIWHYYLIVPVAQVPAADALAPALNNPSGVKRTFRPYLKNVATDEEGQPIWEYDENGDIINATHWIATFVATDLTTDGIPSKELLESALTDNPALANIMWIRSNNPHHPDTTEAEKNIVVASNWAAFLAGNGVDWDAVITSVGELL